MKLFEDIRILNIGTQAFIKDYVVQEILYTHVQWEIPANGLEEVRRALHTMYKNRDYILKANKEALHRIQTSTAYLVDIDLAKNVIPNMTSTTILHSGPACPYEHMSGPAKGAILGALLYEGLAQTFEEAETLASSGTITFAPCHEYSAVGPMAGIISASMPVHVLYNETYERYAYATVNEGLGKVLRYGANDSDVLSRLVFIKDHVMPIVKEALSFGRIDIKYLMNQALQMGDECHNRNKAATSLFFREITTQILKTKADPEEQYQVLDFINTNDHYFLNLSMPACKCMLDAAENIEYSTLVYTMTRNGVDFGIRVSGCGSTWFTAEANYIEGLYFPGFKKEDAAKDIGDSAITETFGIGGFCMGAAPAIVQFVGGSVQDALAYTQAMYAITLSKNTQFMLPAVNFSGIPQGIDLLKVIETGVLPVINTGIAHKDPGIGQIGAGIVHPPMEVFIQALCYIAKKMEEL